MAVRRFTNTAAQATITTGIASTDTSATLSGFSGYPAVPFTATFERGTANEEVVLVTAVAASTVTMSRGYDGTTAKSHAAGAPFLHTVGAIDFTEANAHVNAASGVHGLTGAVVGTSDAQTLSNKAVTNSTHQATSTADAVTANVPSGQTKSTFVGQNNGVTTFSVSQTGVVTASGQVNATAGLVVTGNSAVSGNETVGGTFGVTGISTFTAKINANGGVDVAGAVTATGALSGTTITGTGLITGAGVRVTANGIRHVPITAPAGTAGDVTEWVQSDGGFYFRNGTGSILRSATYWGTATSFPNGALVGDTIVRTDLGNALMVCTVVGSPGTWRQEAPAEMTATQRAALVTTGLHPGFRVYETDTARYYRWSTAFSGFWDYEGGGAAPKITAPIVAGWYQFNGGFDVLTFTKTGGLVTISGLIGNNNAYSSPVQLLNAGGLPVGYRPAASGAAMGNFIVGNTSIPVGRMDIAPDGNINMIPFSSVPANSYHGIAVTYPAGL